MSSGDLADDLQRVFTTGVRPATVENLRRLSGGASQETWSFDLHTAGIVTPLILRRGVGGQRQSAVGSAGIDLDTEAQLIDLAGSAGVPVPGVHRVLSDRDGLGSGFLMERIAGETIPRKILRDDVYAAARPRMARQCGEILARIHSIAPSNLPAELPDTPASVQLDQYRSLYDSFDDPLPVFELAFRWLSDHQPDEVAATLVHGDFRNGNLIVDADGIRAVLDWELAHRGDPMEDLGWLCVNSWRFGEMEHPVGGFGRREDLFAGYEAVSGTVVDAARVHYWEVFGSLKWGVMCKVMYGIFRSGLDRSVERAAIGRRVSETEIDLLQLLIPRKSDE